jgi:hypothetical protein
MLAALPYALCRPAIDPIVAAVQETRAAAGASRPPAYAAPTETDRQLYEDAWRRGFDVKFGLGSLVMQSLAMAPVSALGVVLLYRVLAAWLGASRPALWLALLYGFGTPIFLRAGFLNHNAMMATTGLLGFAALWGRGVLEEAGVERRFLVAGLAGGLSVLLDYSGVILLAGLGLYGLARHARGADAAGLARIGLCYTIGFLGPLLLLWFYQWQSFGHPFYPAQHWMTPTEYFRAGYRGFDWPQPELARMLAFDYRYGLFTSCPLFLLALAAPFVNRRLAEEGRVPRLPRLELLACVAVFAALFVFFSSVHYTRWQFNTGVRYLVPAFPFLFLLVVVVLAQLPRLLAGVVAVLSIAFAWATAMVRDVSGGKVALADPDAGRGVLDPVLRVLTEGPQLPALTTLSRMQGYGVLGSGNLSPLPFFALAGVALYVVWRRGQRGRARPPSAAPPASSV